MSAMTPDVPVERLAADAAALARAVSLAIRIEPQLLRRMRLTLFPSFDAGTEADVWFSAVVETRTSSGIILFPSAREMLRQQLGSDTTALETAWNVVESLHRTISPAVFAEEKLAYLTLAGKQEELRDVLRSVIATLVSPRGRDLAGWAAQAANRLPEPARLLEEAQMLTVGANLRLSEHASRDVSVSLERASEWAPWLAPGDLEMLPFGVALLEDAVEFGSVGRPSSHRILLPKTTPVIIELEWSDGVRRRVERTGLKPNDLTLVEVGPGVTEVDLRTVLGDAYTLTVPATRERGSMQQKLNRVRAPRASITYDFETYGAIEKKELPFVVAVLADLSGSKPSSSLQLKDRKLMEIDIDNFDAVMQALRPRLSIAVSNPKEESESFTVDLEFLSRQDFEPTAVARQIQPARNLLEARNRLATVRSMIVGNTALEADLSGHLLQTGSEASSGVTASPESVSDVRMIADSLTRAGKLGHEQVEELANALFLNRDSMFGFKDLESAINELLKKLDARLSEWLNSIMHNHAFQALEATWRGLNYLVQQTQTGEQMKIRIWDVSKSELARDLDRSPKFDQSVVFKKVHGEGYGVLGASPISLLLGAYEFDRSQEDISLLRHMAAVAASGCTPFLAATSPATFNMESFEQLSAPLDLARLFDLPDAGDWKRLRESAEAAYVGLTLPHILLRLPYGPETVPVEEFDFREDAGPSGRSKLLWGNAAFALTARINNSFAKYAWPTAIRGVEGGGLVEGLSTYTFLGDDGDIVLNCPTEIPIADRREHELSRLGFIPLCYTSGTDMAAFFSVNSIQKPAIYNDDIANITAQLSSMLSYRLAASRFAHYLKCMMRDKIGSFMAREQAEQFLNKWITNYVQKEPDLPPMAKAIQPLQSARVEVQEIKGQPGGFQAVLYIRPDFMLEDPLRADMRLIIDLDSPAG